MLRLGHKKHPEKKFADSIETLLGKTFKRYQVRQGVSLLYKLIVARGLRLRPEDIKSPSRGKYAFQTDILISEKDGTPLVVIELKSGGFSTHDVLTYSSKALKHKEIYPYLRYGFVVEGQRTLDRKFFVHNTGFDFAMTMGSLSSARRNSLIKLIREQLQIAKRLSRLVEENDDLPKSYEAKVVFR